VKGNLRTTSIGFLVAAIMVVAGVWLHSREPVYQGKSLSYWLVQLRTANRPQAERVFLAFGAKAVPILDRKLIVSSGVGKDSEHG